MWRFDLEKQMWLLCLSGAWSRAKSPRVTLQMLSHEIVVEVVRLAQSLLLSPGLAGVQSLFPLPSNKTRLPGHLGGSVG